MSDTAKPKILLFAPLCYPPAGSEAIVTSKLVIAMIEAGWHIDVITQADFGQFYPSNKERLWDPILRVLHSIEGIRNGGFVDTISNRRLFRFLKRGRPLLWACKAAIKGWGLMRNKTYDYVLSRAAPQYGHLPALMLSYLYEVPWIASWSDPMPPRKAPPPYGEGKTTRLPVYIQFYYKALSARVDRHIIPCERLKNYFADYVPAFKSKSYVIPHIVLTKLCMPPSDTLEFTICHAGSLAHRDIVVFLGGVRRFIRGNPAAESTVIKFIGPSTDSLQQIVDSLELNKNIEIHDTKTYVETQAELARSTALVIIEAHVEEGIFFPSKFADYVQTGRPILAVSPVSGNLHDLISLYGGGIAADNTDELRVEEALSTLFLTWRQGALQKSYGSSIYDKLFTEQKILADYLHIFGNLT